MTQEEEKMLEGEKNATLLFKGKWVDSILPKEDPWQLHPGNEHDFFKELLGDEMEGRGMRNPEELRVGGLRKDCV